MHTTCSFTSDWLRNWHQIFLAIHTQYKTKLITAIADSQLGESCSIEQTYNKLCNRQPIKTRHFTASIYFRHEVSCVLNQKSSDSQLLKMFCFVLLFSWLNFPQAQVSVHRLEEFLKLEEIQPDNVIRNMPSHRKFGHQLLGENHLLLSALPINIPILHFPRVL